MLLVARLGTILLGILLILWSLTVLLGVSIPGVLLALLGLVAGICLLASQVRVMR